MKKDNDGDKKPREKKEGCICQGGNTQPYCAICTPPPSWPSHVIPTAERVDADPPQPSLYDRRREETMKLAYEVLRCSIPDGEGRQAIMWAKRFANELLSAPSATVTPEQFNDVLKRIVSRMNGHTVGSAELPAFRNFMGLLNRTTPYSCGIGPMPREGNSAATDDGAACSCGATAGQYHKTGCGHEGGVQWLRLLPSSAY